MPPAPRFADGIFFPPPPPPPVTPHGWLGHGRWSSTKLTVFKKRISQGDRPIPNLGLATTRGSCSVTQPVRDEDGQNRGHPSRASAAPGPQFSGRAQAEGRVPGGFSHEDEVVAEQQVQRIKPRGCRRLLHEQHHDGRAADPPPSLWLVEPPLCYSRSFWPTIPAPPCGNPRCHGAEGHPEVTLETP